MYTACLTREFCFRQIPEWYRTALCNCSYLPPLPLPEDPPEEGEKRSKTEQLEPLHPRKQTQAQPLVLSLSVVVPWLLQSRASQGGGIEQSTPPQPTG